MQKRVFRVGITRDIRRSDGLLSFAPVVSRLELLDVPGVACDFLPEDRRPLTPDLLQGLDGLYHFSSQVTAASLDGVDRLVLLARHGVGLDFVDLAACTERAIAVTITPDGVTRPMASAAATLVLALAHRLPERDRALHRGDWGDGRFAPIGTALTGRTLGLVGYGRIGRELVRLLASWRPRVAVTTRHALDEGGVEWLPLDDLLATADIVVVACPLTEDTRGLIDARRLGLMKPGALLVNIARGGIVDQAALVTALREGHLAGAGVDVVDPEPLPADDPLLSLPNVIGAPHSLGYTDELVRGCVEYACEALLTVARGEVPGNVANPAVLEDARFKEKLARLARREQRAGSR